MASCLRTIYVIVMTSLHVISGRQHPEMNCTVTSQCAYRDVITVPNFWRRYGRCQCDAECGFYGDCCADAAAKSPIDGAFPGGATPDVSSYLRCHSILSLSRKFIYIISTCPESYPEGLIRSYCERPLQYDRGADDVSAQSARAALENETEKRLLRYIPVTSLRNHVLYRNRYCASCHGQRDVIFWKVKMMGRKAFDVSVLDDPAALGDLFRQSLASQRLLFLPWNKTLAARVCTPSVRACDVTWKDDVTRAECARYTAYTWLPGTGAYRNPDCAVCNHANLSLTHCLGTSHLTSGGFPGGGSGPLAFALLLDINTGTAEFQGAMVGYTAVKTRLKRTTGDCDGNLTTSPFLSPSPSPSTRSPYAIPLSPDTASDDDREIVMDPFTGSCVMVYCPVGQDLIDDETDCVHVARGNGTLMESSSPVLNVKKFGPALGVVTLVGNCLSITGLLVQLAVYASIPQLRNTPGKSLMCLSGSLLVAQILFTTAGAIQTEYAPCLGLAILMHYSFLAYFTWMCVMSYDVWRAFNRTRANSFRTQEKSRSMTFVRYSTFAWGAPLAVVVISAILESVQSPGRPMYALGNLCFIGSRYGLLYLFAIPMATILIIDIIFYAMTAHAIWRASEAGAQLRRRGGDHSRLLLYVRLASVMGLTWIFGFVAAAADRLELWYVFTILNASQGVFICVAFVFTRNVQRLLLDRVRRRNNSVNTSRKYTSDVTRGNNDVHRGTLTSSTKVTVISA